jgi:predicted transcriptional regulator
VSAETVGVLAVIDGLPAAVKAVRVIRGQSLREVARLTGESASTVMRVEAGSDCNLTTARALIVWIGATA